MGLYFKDCKTLLSSLVTDAYGVCAKIVCCNDVTVVGGGGVKVLLTHFSRSVVLKWIRFVVPFSKNGDKRVLCCWLTLERIKAVHSHSRESIVGEEMSA